MVRDRWDKLPWKLDFSGLKYFKFADRNLNALRYHSMQFKGKLMNKTWENDKKPSFRPNFGPLDSHLGSKFFFVDLISILDVRHCCKLSLYTISRKTNEQNLRKWQKPNFGPDFDLFSSNSGRQSFLKKIWLRQSLDITSYHHVQYQERTNNPILRNWLTDEG